MERLKLLLPLILFSTQIISATSFKERLIGVNQEWAQRPADLAAIADDTCEYNEIEMIQKHLLLVHGLLLEKDVSHLPLAQQEQRQRSLRHLLQYAQRGVFPENLTHTGRRPIFIDHRGIHCAVGYLIAKSGSPQLSQRISADMNTYYLRDMRDQYLEDWVASSGFSLGELAWIQPGYPMAVNWETMKGGTNGPVHSVTTNNQGGIIAGGNFDTAGGMNINNLANWFAGVSGYDWTNPSNSAPTGPVYDVLNHEGNMYMGGQFFGVDTMATPSCIVMWDGSTWHPLGEFYHPLVPPRVNDLQIYRDTLYAAGNFLSKETLPSEFYNLAKWNGTKWVPASTDTAFPALLPGEVHALHVHNGKLVVAGDFELQDSLQTRNIFMLNGNEMEYFAEDIPNPVYALESYNGELYAGGQYLNQAKTDTAGLMAYRNNKWEALIQFAEWREAAIYDLESTPDGLVLGGDFDLPAIMTVASNIAAYNNGPISLGVLDSTVKSLHFENDRLYIGGHFTNGYNGGNVALGHITNIYLPDYLGEESYETKQLSVYPNPAQNSLKLELQYPGAVNALHLVDMKGVSHEVPFEEKGREVVMDISGLRRGAYILRLQMGGSVMEEPLLIAD